MSEEDMSDFSDVEEECPQIPLSLPFHKENLAQTLSTIIKTYPNEAIAMFLDHRWPQPDLDGTYLSMRFRINLGCRESQRVRNALLFLAEAMKLDNQEHPQQAPKGSPP